MPVYEQNPFDSLEAGCVGTVAINPLKTNIRVCGPDGYSDQQEHEPEDLHESEISKLAEFVVEHSGDNKQYGSGMIRSKRDGKTDYTLTRYGPMWKRWNEHLRKGAIHYGKNNWLRGDEEALPDAIESAARHFEEWLDHVMFGTPITEDVAAAVFFNINLVEYLLEKRKKNDV